MNRRNFLFSLPIPFLFKKNKNETESIKPPIAKLDYCSSGVPVDLSPVKTIDYSFRTNYCPFLAGDFVLINNEKFCITNLTTSYTVGEPSLLVDISAKRSD